MGDRWVMEIKCPKCNKVDPDVYFAPTCGFTEWTCGACGMKVDLIALTGITPDKASNRDEISRIIANIATGDVSVERVLEDDAAKVDDDPDDEELVVA